jgi:hypothetical protein
MPAKGIVPKGKTPPPLQFEKGRSRLPNGVMVIPGIWGVMVNPAPAGGVPVKDGSN